MTPELAGRFTKRGCACTPVVNDGEQAVRLAQLGVDYSAPTIPTASARRCRIGKLA